MSNKHLYENYYNNQIGRGIPHYAGLSRVSGHGFASMLGNVWRFLSPVVAPTLQIVKKEALDTGLKLLHDLAQNRPIKTAVKKRMSRAGKNIVQTTLKRLQGGKKKSVHIKAKPVKKKQSCSKPRRDIFT